MLANTTEEAAQKNKNHRAEKRVKNDSSGFAHKEIICRNVL